MADRPEVAAATPLLVSSVVAVEEVEAARVSILLELELVVTTTWAWADAARSAARRPRLSRYERRRLLPRAPQTFIPRLLVSGSTLWWTLGIRL